MTGVKWPFVMNLITCYLELNKKVLYV